MFASSTISCLHHHSLHMTNVEIVTTKLPVCHVLESFWLPCQAQTDVRETANAALTSRDQLSASEGMDNDRGVQHGGERYMMTSSNGNIFRVTGPLWGEFTGHRWIPRTTASDAEFWYFSLDLRLIKRLSKHSWGWWFETPSCSLWRHCNETMQSVFALLRLIESKLKMQFALNMG